MYAAIVPNAAGVTGALDTFATTVDEVERRAGFDFFSGLDDAEESELEARLQHLPDMARNSHVAAVHRSAAR